MYEQFMVAHAVSERPAEPGAQGTFDLVGHSFRVAAYAVELARRAGVGDEAGAAEAGGDELALHHVYLAGLLHDVGKLFIPRAVFETPGALAPAANTLVRRHPELGRAFLARGGAPAPVVELVYAHHERWDGRGYPRGLAGEEIALGARIVTVADTYDAITSHRVYRPARSHGLATDELMRAAGAQLDPRLVARFVTIPATTLLAIAATRPIPDLLRRVLDVRSRHDQQCGRREADYTGLFPLHF